LAEAPVRGLVGAVGGRWSAWTMRISPRLGGGGGDDAAGV